MSYVWPHRSVKRQDKDMRLQILVRAEGPTRVLFIVDLLVSPPIVRTGELAKWWAVWTEGCIL